MAVYAWRERRRLGATLVLTVILSLLAAVEPLPLKLLVDNAIGGAPLPPVAIQLLQNSGLRPDAWLLVVMAALATLLILMASAFLIAAISWLWAFAGQAMVVDLTTDLFSRLQRLSLQFHRTRPLGDSLSRLTTDSWSVYSFTSILVAAPIREMATLDARHILML
jgi:ATP-binding cassette subfamily B protein